MRAPMPPPTKKKKSGPAEPGKGEDSTKAGPVAAIQGQSIARRVRLAKMRRPRQSDLTPIETESPLNCTYADRRGIELVLIADKNESGNPMRANAGVPQNVVADSHQKDSVNELGRDHRRAPTNPATNMPNVDDQVEKRRLSLLSVLLALCLYTVVCMILVVRKNNKPAELDCERSLPFSSAVCLAFLGYVLAATLFRPRESDVVSSVQHRLLFSKLTLLFVCIFTVIAGSIGYPQGLCEIDCVCGACRPELTGIDGEHDSSALNFSVVNKSAISSCAKREVSLDTHSSFTGVEICSSTSMLAISPPEMCGIDSTRSKAVLSRYMNITDVANAKAHAETILRTFRSVTYLFGSFFSNDVTDKTSFFKAANATCNRQHTPQCPQLHALTKLDTSSFYRSVIIPTVCDKLYTFCDRNDKPRLACSETICCEMCKQVMDVGNCSARLVDMFLKNVGSQFEGIERERRKAVALGLDPGLIDEVFDATEWVLFTALSLLNRTDIYDGSCMQVCQEKYATRAYWYASTPECLPRARRTDIEQTEQDNAKETNSSRPIQTPDGRCMCDARAQAWSLSVILLHGCMFLAVVILVGLQVWVAIMHDGETCRLASGINHCRFRNSQQKRAHFQRICLRAKEQILAVVASTALVACLVTQINVVASASAGTKCLGQPVSLNEPLFKDQALKNASLMSSWVALHLAMYFVVMYCILTSGVYWLLRHDFARAEAQVHATNIDPTKRNAVRKTLFSSPETCAWLPLIHRCVAKMLLCAKLIADAKERFDDLFSFERGRYYIYVLIVFEIIEVVNQTSQLISFSLERPREWVMSLSIVLILNGIALPAPMLLGRISPKLPGERIKLYVSMLDVLFDLSYLLIAILFSDKQDFGRQGSWLVATLGVALPVRGIAVAIRDMSTDVRVQIASSEWEKEHGTETPRRQSTVVASPLDKVDRSHTSHKACGRCKHANSLSSQGVLLSLTAFASLFGIFVGGLFLYMSAVGDAACRDLLGEALWEGSAPKRVFVISDDSGWPHLRGGCNYLGIHTISSIPVNGVPRIVSLPASLSQLKHLVSLKLQGQNIASDGIPATILDGRALPELSLLELGESNPVSRSLDLSHGGKDIDEFPPYVLRFMTGLESLSLRGSNISCFPQQDGFARLSKLRRIDLRDTMIGYVPPSVVFGAPELDIELAGSPVSRSLDWSDHGLTSAVFDFRRFAVIFPTLTSLNVSVNALTDANALDFKSLQWLVSLDVSRNPFSYKSNHFSWFQMLVEHPMMGHNASFVGLASVGLNPEHVQLQNVSGLRGSSLTCAHLRWIRRMATHPQRIDLSGNVDFELMFSWQNRKKFRCQCSKGAACAYVDEAVLLLLSRILPSVRSLSLGAVFQSNIRNYSRLVSMDRLLNMIVQQAPSMAHLSVVTGESGKYGNCRGGIGGGSIFGIEHLTNLEVLVLDCNRLTGTIPREISRLTKLRTLSLNDNQMNGVLPRTISLLENLEELHVRSRLWGHMGIPGFDIAVVRLASLSKMTYLDMSHNRVANNSFPIHVTKLTMLEGLSMNSISMRNNIIPKNISALTKLTLLDIGGTKLRGRIPTTITMLTNLRHLKIDGCELSGSLPDGFEALRVLNRLILVKNNLSGPLPNILSRMTTLEHLKMGMNRFTGPIPPGWSKLTNLEELFLDDNALTGGIPSFLLTKFSRLRYLYLDHNLLTGKIPEDVMPLPFLNELRLDNNLLTGVVPKNTLARLPKLKFLTLFGNNYSEPVPRQIGHLCRDEERLSYQPCK